jgi:hypothetical protein
MQRLFASAPVGWRKFFGEQAELLNNIASVCESKGIFIDLSVLRSLLRRMAICSVKSLRCLVICENLHLSAHRICEVVEACACRESNFEGWAMQGVLAIDSLVCCRETVDRSLASRVWRSFVVNLVKHVNRERTHIWVLSWDCACDGWFDEHMSKVNRLGYDAFSPTGQGKWKFDTNKQFTLVNSFFAKDHAPPIRWELVHHLRCDDEDTLSMSFGASS